SMLIHTYPLFFAPCASPLTSTLFPYSTLFRSFKYEDRHAGVVVLSGPQLSLNEIRKVANLLEGKKVAKDTTFIITTPESTYTQEDRKSTRLNSSHVSRSYAVFCLKRKKIRSYT